MQIGHVHLKISDLQRSIDFYQNVLGLEVTERLADRFAFMSAGRRHHELALQEVGPVRQRRGGRISGYTTSPSKSLIDRFWLQSTGNYAMRG